MSVQKPNLKSSLRHLKDKALLLRASAATIRTTDPCAASRNERRAAIVEEQIKELS